MATPPNEIALLEAAVDRFEQQPLPKGGPALASFVERVQRINDRITLKNSQAGRLLPKQTNTKTRARCLRFTGCERTAT